MTLAFMKPRRLCHILVSLLCCLCWLLAVIISSDLGLGNCLHGSYFKRSRESNLSPGSAKWGLQSGAYVESGKGISLENSKGYWKGSLWKFMQCFPFQR